MRNRWKEFLYALKVGRRQSQKVDKCLWKVIRGVRDYWFRPVFFLPLPPRLMARMLFHTISRGIQARWPQFWTELWIPVRNELLYPGMQCMHGKCLEIALFLLLVVVVWYHLCFKPWFKEADLYWSDIQMAPYIIFLFWMSWAACSLRVEQGETNYYPWE